MDDLISRQDAIDALTSKSIQLHGLHWGDHPEAPHIESGVLSSIDIIRGLPSAQPDVPDTKDGDMVSRQAAIKLIERMKPYHQNADDIAEMIANMPSAQLEIIRCKDCNIMCKWVNEEEWKEWSE